MIKISVTFADGTTETVDQSLVPKGSDGRPLTRLTGDIDADGIYVADTAFYDEEAYQKALGDWKEARALAVENIEVTYKDNVFQGDETSQGRMAVAISALPDEVVTVGWTAKDNTVVQLNKADLSAILLIAGQAQSALWNEGRPTKV